MFALKFPSSIFECVKWFKGKTQDGYDEVPSLHVRWVSDYSEGFPFWCLLPAFPPNTETVP